MFGLILKVDGSVALATIIVVALSTCTKLLIVFQNCRDRSGT
jgi:hypothetical protein